eukprot:COSAG02_NODE_7868_length_2811_cov_2.691740_1_plen_384_part_00
MRDRSSDSHGHARPDTVLHEDVPPEPVRVQIAPEQWYQFYTKDDKVVQGPYTLHEMRAYLGDIWRSRGSAGLSDVEVRCFSGPTPTWEVWARRESWRELDDELLGHAAVDIDDHLANYLYEMKVCDEALDGPLTVNSIRERIVELGLHRGALSPVLVRKCEPSWGDWREAVLFDELIPEALKLLEKARMLTRDHRWGEAIEACDNGLAICGTEDPQLTSDLETAKRIACGGRDRLADLKSKEQCKQRLRRGSCALLVVLVLLLLWWLVPPDPGDCFGNWSVCGSDCIKIYTVHVEAEDGGSGCAHDHGASEVCQPGQGGCPRVSGPAEPPEPLEPGPEPELECGCGGNNNDDYGILQSLLEDTGYGSNDREEQHSASTDCIAD